MNTLFDYKVRDIYASVERPRPRANEKKKEEAIPDDAMGIEIEMEMTNPLDVGTLGLQNFTAKNDGSLRNWGVEFVSKPISFKERKALLDEFDNVLSSKNLDTRIEDCARTSVHVHVNMKNKTYLQLMNILTAYAICEGPMVAWCGPTRMGNLFALRIPESATNFDATIKQTSAYEAYYPNGELRYSALNMCSLLNFNTLEFRSLRGVYDVKVYDKWMMALSKLIDVASNEFRNPLEIVEFFQTTPNNAFLHRFLGDLIYDIENLSRPCYNLMEEGYEYALSLATCHVDNWELDPKNDWRNDPVMVQYFKENGYERDLSKIQFSYWDYQRVKKANIGNPPPHRADRQVFDDFDPEPDDDDGAIFIPDEFHDDQPGEVRVVAPPAPAPAPVRAPQFNQVGWNELRVDWPDPAPVADFAERNAEFIRALGLLRDQDRARRNGNND